MGLFDGQDIRTLYWTRNDLLNSEDVPGIMKRLALEFTLSTDRPTYSSLLLREALAGIPARMQLYLSESIRQGESPAVSITRQDTNGANKGIRESLDPSLGPVFPFVRINRDGSWLDPSTEYYSRARSILDTVNIGIDGLIENVRSASVDAINGALVATTVEVKPTATQAEMEYLWRLTARLYPMMPSNLTGDPLYSLLGFSNRYEIQALDEAFGIRLSHFGIELSFEPPPDGLNDGEFFIEVRRNTNIGGGDLNVPVASNAFVKVGRVQGGGSALCYKMRAPFMGVKFYDIVPVGQENESVEFAGAQLGIDETATVVPVFLDILQEMDISAREALFYNTMHLYVFQANVQHVEWYETAQFRRFLQLTVWAVTLWTLGQGYTALLAAGYTVTQAIVITVALNIGIAVALDYAIEFLVEELGEVGAVLAAILYIVALAYAPDIVGISLERTTAHYLLHFAVGLTRAHGFYVENLNDELAREARMFHVERERLEKELDELRALLDTSPDFDIVGWLRPRPIFVPGETPNDYFARTQVANPGILGFDILHNHVDIALELPKIDRTLRNEVGRNA